MLLSQWRNQPIWHVKVTCFIENHPIWSWPICIVAWAHFHLTNIFGWIHVVVWPVQIVCAICWHMTCTKGNISRGYGYACTASPHPVVEADDRPLLNITLSKQALPRPWDAALANLPIHKLINYFEAKGAAQLCFWGREKNQLFKNYASPAQRSARKDLQGRGSWGMAACLRGFWVTSSPSGLKVSFRF